MKIGDRVKCSGPWIRQHPRQTDRRGAIVAKSRRYSGWYVKWDGYRATQLYAELFLEVIKREEGKHE